MDPQPYRPAGVDAGYRVDVLYFRVQYVGVYSHRPVERHRGRFRDYRGPGRIVDYGLCLGRREIARIEADPDLAKLLPKKKLSRPEKGLQ